MLVFELILPELVIRKIWKKSFANDFQNNFLKHYEAEATGFSSKFCILIIHFPFICVLCLPISVLLHLPFCAPEQALYLSILYLKRPLFFFSVSIPVLFLPPHTECIQNLERPGVSLHSSVFFIFLASCQV